MRARRVSMLIGLATLLAGSVAAAGTASAGQGDARTYQVTIQNLTVGQPLTPPVVATHKRRADVFTVGAPASFGVKEVAENGNVPALVDELHATKGVTNVAVAVSPGPGPLPAGGSVTVMLQAAEGARFASFVSMLICTNDGFSGVDALRLPNRVGETARTFSFAYDAGTEINSEKFVDIVPPCQTLGPIDKGIPGSGTSSPALAEGGVIHHHPGIDGTIGDLTQAHAWRVDLPVSTFAVTRVG